MSFLNFVQYHNAVPIAVSILILGSASAFAATNPDTIYSQQQQVVSIDNTYIVDKDLTTFTPKAVITAVTEDTNNYYVAYTFSTIDLKDSVWQDVQKNETLTVSKADLGPYRDLGVYVTEQLRQQVDREKENLAQVQTIERKNVTQKTVATTYGGIIGKLLTDTTETLPGYTPIVKGLPAQPAVSDAPDQLAGAAAPSTNQSSNQPPSQTTTGTSGNPSLQMQILGNNPAQIPIGTSYVDLGAIVTDAANDNIGVHTFVNGAEVQQIQLDTSTTSVWTIAYQASDPQGNQVSGERKVYVYDPVDGPPLGDTTVSTPAVLPVVTTTPTTTQSSGTTSTSTSNQTPSTSTNTGTTTTQTSPASATTTPSSSTSTSTTPSSTATTTPTTATSTTTTSTTQTSSSTTTTTTTTPASTATTTPTTTTNSNTTQTSASSATSTDPAPATTTTGTASSTPASSGSAATSTTP